MRLLHAAPAALLLLALGCGGGSSVGELTISAQNAEALASAGVGAVSTLDGMSQMVDDFSQSFFNPAAQVFPCDSGNVMLTVNDVGATGLSTGDNASLDFNACVLDLGGGSLVFNGNFYLSATDVTDDPSGAFTREFYASCGSLTMALGTATVVANGALTVGLSSPDGVTLVADVSGDAFSAFAKAGNQAFSGTIKDFHSTRSLDTSTGDYTVDYEATIVANALGGSAHFQTTVPFTGNGTDYPSAGTFVATGAMGGTITLTAVDNVNVQIFVDADGDGVAETTINTTWAALDNNN
jgi:hypothetical protein